MEKETYIIVVTVALILIVGCVHIEIHQKIKRNGKYDVDIRITSEPERRYLLAELDEQLLIHKDVQDRFSFIEDEESVVLSFQDLTSNDRLLFDKNSKSSYLKAYEDYTFLNPEEIRIERTMHFPYYVYEMRIGCDEEVPKGWLRESAYILDEAGMVSEQNRSMYGEIINSIYETNDIEVLVVTKNYLSESDARFFYLSLADKFRFAKEDSYHVIIIVSKSTDGICRIETNINSVPGVSRQVSAIEKNLSLLCHAKPSAAIEKSLRQLEELFSKQRVSPNLVAGLFDDLFRIEYVVEVFGRVIETNGERINDHEVMFDISPLRRSEHTVIFRDTILATHLGDYYGIFVFIIMISGLSAGVIILRKSGNKIDKRIILYVKQARAAGISDTEITEKLRKGGWSQDIITRSLKS
ncbi:MAG: hypothetical protein ABH879_08415 [archaeon]